MRVAAVFWGKRDRTHGRGERRRSGDAGGGRDRDAGVGGRESASGEDRKKSSAAATITVGSRRSQGEIRSGKARDGLEGRDDTLWDRQQASVEGIRKCFGSQRYFFGWRSGDKYGGTREVRHGAEATRRKVGGSTITFSDGSLGQMCVGEGGRDDEDGPNPFPCPLREAGMSLLSAPKMPCQDRFVR